MQKDEYQSEISWLEKTNTALKAKLASAELLLDELRSELSGTDSCKDALVRTLDTTVARLAEAERRTIKRCIAVLESYRNFDRRSVGLLCELLEPKEGERDEV